MAVESVASSRRRTGRPRLPPLWDFAEILLQVEAATRRARGRGAGRPARTPHRTPRATAREVVSRSFICGSIKLWASSNRCVLAAVPPSEDRRLLGPANRLPSMNGRSPRRWRMSRPGIRVTRVRVQCRRAGHFESSADAAETCSHCGLNVRAVSFPSGDVTDLQAGANRCAVRYLRPRIGRLRHEYGVFAPPATSPRSAVDIHARVNDGSGRCRTRLSAQGRATALCSRFRWRSVGGPGRRGTLSAMGVVGLLSHRDARGQPSPALIPLYPPFGLWSHHER